MSKFIDNVTRVCMIVTMLLIIYSMYAMIWDFNPMKIVAFNLRIFSTSTLSFLLAVAVQGFMKKLK